MSISPSRRLAYRVLLRVEAGEGFAADLLRTQAGAGLSEADLNLANEIVFGALRRRGEIDDRIVRLSGRKIDVLDREIAAILRLGIYQILWLDRVPTSAAVHEAVELAKAARKRSAVGFVNAVLRKCAPQRTPGEAIPDAPKLALPEWLATRWARDFGEDAALALAGVSLHPPRNTVWLTDSSIDPQAAAAELAGEGIVTRPCRYAVRSLTVESGRVTRSRLWKSGKLVIQDEASQLIADLVRPASGSRVLDLCGAPGMKAARIASAMGAGRIVSCDRSWRRLAGMGEILALAFPAGVTSARVMLDASMPLPFAPVFDRILLDAPCSGTGTLARNPELKWRLAPADIERLAQLQKLMLRAALAALAPGGRLVYATCSLEPEENEEVVSSVLSEIANCRRLTSAELIDERPELESLIDESGFFRTRPDRDGCDGFFASVIVRAE